MQRLLSFCVNPRLQLKPNACLPMCHWNPKQPAQQKEHRLTVQGWKSEKDPPAFCQRGRQPEEVDDNVKIVSGD
jgi:hypothetical protein